MAAGRAMRILCAEGLFLAGQLAGAGGQLRAIQAFGGGLLNPLLLDAGGGFFHGGQICGGMLDGPLAFDNAISVEAARIKGIRSEVAGNADILVVPDLESGNMLAKQLSYLAAAASAGIVMGARVPIVLTSRAEDAQGRLASAAVANVVGHRLVIGAGAGE